MRGSFFQFIVVFGEIFSTIDILDLRSSLDLFQSARICAVLHDDDHHIGKALISAAATHHLVKGGDCYTLPLSDRQNYEKGAARL